MYFPWSPLDLPPVAMGWIFSVEGVLIAGADCQVVQVLHRLEAETPTSRETSTRTKTRASARVSTATVGDHPIWAKRYSPPPPPSSYLDLIKVIDPRHTYQVLVLVFTVLCESRLPRPNPSPPPRPPRPPLPPPPPPPCKKTIYRL